MESALTARPRIIDRRWFIRLLEILPGAVTWSVIVLPVVASLFVPVAVAYFIIAFDLYWMVKSFRLSGNLIRGYRKMDAVQKIDWNERLEWLKRPRKHLRDAERNLNQLVARHARLGQSWLRWTLPKSVRLEYEIALERRSALQELVRHERTIMNPDSLYHAVILATYNETLDILEPSVQALIETDFPTRQLMLVIAYEERGGERTEANAKYLIEKYGHHFAYAVAIKHPDGLIGEVRGKGGNITYAGRALTEYVREKGIDPEHIIVTTFDSDHRASRNYFPYLSYLYATDPNRIRKSYQPIPMFYNNIWDVPAPMRVIATGNSFWMLMETMRPHRLRNFAAHAQSLQALIDTDFWSVTTIVEDGHQFWRTYFTYDGDHQVVPVFTPIYQDAVLADTYPKTFKVQYLQLRRWAWGVSDFQYVVRESIRNRRIAWSDKGVQIFRLFEGHFSWATAPLILTFVAWLPLYLNPQAPSDILTHNLPVITSYILRISMVGLLVTIFISLILLPPRPARYRRIRSLGMVAQWALLPVTTLVFSSLAAIDSQTRLMFGRYLGFYVTDKAVKK